MSEKIFVIQVLASGPDGYPYDEIVDVGICSVDLDAGNFETVYHNTISRDPKELGKKKLDHLSINYGIFAGDLYGGDPEDKVAKEVLGIIKGNNVACYDIRQVFNKYLICDPWDITLETTVMPAVSARQPISLKCKDPANESEIIRKAYSRTFTNDPANIGEGKRAIDLAQMTACLMIDLRARGKY